ncbi:Crp/Fnr family transcriptional regulator, partial [Hymenobacter guriensis]
NRFQHLRPDYDLQQDGLNDFLDDARAMGNLDSLSADRKVHVVRKKQNIYLEGDEPIRVYFVKSGRVKTLKSTGSGKELITGSYGPGEFFGYLPLLEHTEHSDSAVATDESELVYIPRDDFSLLLQHNPAVGQQFIRLLAGRVSERETQLLTMAYSSIRRRVADTLLKLHAQAGPDAHIHFTREDLAAMVGTATESLIRTLSEFRADGLVELTPKSIRVLQPDQLRSARW